MSDLLIRDVRLDASSGPVDLTIRSGRIDSIGPSPADWSGPALDGGGLLALPGLVDGHAHLDKTTWGLPWRPNSAGPGLGGLIENERTVRHTLPAVAERAGAILDAYIANGTTLIRSHVDVDPDNGLTALEGLVEAVASRRDRIDVQIVAFPQSGVLAAPGTAELLDAAMTSGADLVGGIDPAGFDGDPVEHLDLIFEIATRHGRGVDLHLHDRGTLGRWEIGLVIERTRALAMAGMVTISHAFCLCDGDPSIPELIEGLAEQEISLATVAPGHVDPLPLGLIDAIGVAVTLGQDGIRDLWSPWGDADMLSRAGSMAWRAAYRRDDEIERCVDLATTRGAAAIGVADHAITPGGRGDVVLVDATTPAEAAARHPAGRVVVKAGVVVVDPRAEGQRAADADDGSTT